MKLRPLRLHVALFMITQISGEPSVFLPFLELSDSVSIFTNVLDGATEVMFPQPFYFNSIAYNSAYISSYGLISFGPIPFTDYVTQTFPIPRAVISPYWDDIDLRNTGIIYYESVTNLSDISDFITDSQGSPFTCTSAVVVEWSEVCPYRNDCGNLSNSFQVVLASSQYNHTSYAIFTYKCGSLNWVYNAAIGFSGGQDFYANHDLSQTSDVNDIACLNEPTSPWSNVVYNMNKGIDHDDSLTPSSSVAPTQSSVSSLSSVAPLPSMAPSDPASCTSECNPPSRLPEYYECCDSDNFGNFIKILESGVMRGYIVCLNHLPDWC